MSIPLKTACPITRLNEFISSVAPSVPINPFMGFQMRLKYIEIVKLGKIHFLFSELLNIVKGFVIYFIIYFNEKSSLSNVKFGL